MDQYPKLTKIPGGSILQGPYHEGHILDPFKEKAMERKAFVLLSGGLDSTTCLYKAIYDYAPDDFSSKPSDMSSQDYIKKVIDLPIIREIPLTDWVEGISINYGQRHQKELEYARRSCELLGIRHTILDVGNLLAGAQVMLSKDSVGNVSVPDISYSDIKGVSPTYVPFRNGLMLSAITAHAQKYVNEQIEQSSIIRGEINQEKKAWATSQATGLVGVYFGAHAEDAHNWAYPDCTPEFIGAMANAIHVGSYFTIRLHTPLEWLTKTDVVTLGSKLGVPFENTWSCYKGEELHCGVCPTCRSRKEAFVHAGVTDPTEYAQ